MASILNPLDKEKDEEQQSGAPQQVGGAQSATLGAGTGAPAAGTKSGRFTNISNYLQANSGYNKDGGGLAGKIAGNINNQGQAVKQEVGKAQNEFNTAAQQNRVGYDENTVNNALNDSTNFAQNDQNVDKFQQQLNAKYQGPQGIQNAEIHQNKAQNLQNITNQTTTEGGRFGLLKNMFNKPTYTGGQQKLDNLLLQGNQGQLKNLTGTRQLGNQVVKQVNTTNQQAIDEAQKYKDEAAATAQKTQEQLASTVTGFDSDLENRRLAAEAERKSILDGVTNRLKNAQLTQADYDRMGLKDYNQADTNFSGLYGENLTGGPLRYDGGGLNSGGLNTGIVNFDPATTSLINKDWLNKDKLSLFDTDLTKYVKTSALGATKQNTATESDLARMEALRKLSGGTQQGDLDKILNQLDPNQVGTFAKENPYEFENMSGLRDELRNKTKSYNEELLAAFNRDTGYDWNTDAATAQKAAWAKEVAKKYNADRTLNIDSDPLVDAEEKYTPSIG